MSDYYRDLYQSTDDARRAGWRNRLEQALRYEVALSLIGVSDFSQSRLLDVGCGPGGLLCYMHDTDRLPLLYKGIDGQERAVERALDRALDRSLLPVARFEQTSLEDFYEDELFDGVVAIGALVDGEGVATDRERRRRISRFFETMIQTRSPRGVLILLEQDALEARPLLAMEDALFGLYRREREPMLKAFGERYPDLSFSWHDGFLETDMAIAWRPADEATSDARVTSTALDAVLQGPWTEGLDRHWHAWLCIEAGQGARASAILDDLPDSEHVRLLRARLDA